MSEADGRLLGVGYPGEIADLDASLRELEWVREHGFVSVMVPGNVRTDRPPLFDRYYDPFLAACADLGMVLNLHAGWGVPQGPVYEHFVRMSEGIPLDGELTDLEDFGKSLMEQMDADAEDSPFALDMTPRQTLWQLMLGGVFDRFPRLKLVLTEVRADWLPATLDYLDQRFTSEARNLQLKPSEYFARNCGVTPSSHHRAEIQMRHEIGIDRFMFGADIPHPESTFPNTKAWIGHSFSGVPEAEARKILGENAIRFFGLDGPHFDEIASRIGPTVAEVTGGVDLDERLVQHFDTRGGYLKPVEEVATDKIDERLVSDLARVGAG
jgi:predicted TIM-barrel fold metal-dependent hydrolase